MEYLENGLINTLTILGKRREPCRLTGTKIFNIHLIINYLVNEDRLSLFLLTSINHQKIKDKQRFKMQQRD